MFKQFDNADNMLMHESTTGPEIWEQTDGKVDIFISGVGTGGTCVGCSRFLKSVKPDVHVVAIAPEEAPVISGGEYGDGHKIQGIGPDFVPPNIGDGGDFDEIALCKGDDAIAMSKRLIAEEGLMVGYSAGAAAHVACRLAAMPEHAGKCIVFILPSFGERYLSTKLFEEATQKAKSLPTTPVPE